MDRELEAVRCSHSANTAAHNTHELPVASGLDIIQSWSVGNHDVREPRIPRQPAHPALARAYPGHRAIRHNSGRNVALGRSDVTSVDQTRVTTFTPTWAIVMVFLFIWFFLISLLFLLARDTRMEGFIAVNIQAGKYSYTEQLPVGNEVQRIDVFNRVHFLQTQIGRARSVG